MFVRFRAKRGISRCVTVLWTEPNYAMTASAHAFHNRVSHSVILSFNVIQHYLEANLSIKGRDDWKNKKEPPVCSYSVAVTVSTDWDRVASHCIWYSDWVVFRRVSKMPSSCVRFEVSPQWLCRVYMNIQVFPDVVLYRWVVSDVSVGCHYDLLKRRELLNNTESHSARRESSPSPLWEPQTYTVKIILCSHVTPCSLQTGVVIPQETAAAIFRVEE
jgi:hypothetical protein